MRDEEFAPSEKKGAASVKVDISNLQPGEMMTVAWRGKPVWIANRTDAMLPDRLLWTPRPRSRRRSEALFWDEFVDRFPNRVYSSACAGDYVESFSAAAALVKLRVTG